MCGYSFDKKKLPKVINTLTVPRINIKLLSISRTLPVNSQLNTYSVLQFLYPIQSFIMHVSKLIAFGAMFLAVDAFKCAVGQQGSCTYVESDAKQHRCAIKCSYKGGYAKCTCPQYYPRNDKKWPYGGKHACISTPQYVDRFKC
ncbi:unnamed protein product [Fusarium graminearum]|uniref:Chromosome 2, complete genome n=1 Tax=Gibberella zeae (strain ATCC MYA-4620 / CBS 123657 / FGSC 9075 / NRRL 31084 / PH-1) TaxID=229533 RepID=I1S6N0_GIBZE|nr:hypothetical protein FGSG_12503 [Fusarium graminearum PH-1]ESU10139.1 hypothetical protein FGSG_12503 [Fusarium graminearum PH-1]EYB25615.1 hypothetical protein FG05_12503 [Fusarium graminearum]CEF77870.1 unnamed protein product [Fusarium graminearum]CZS81167.1 unnamed protein product [Fusarium graminearum]|eukprot:XP_011322638.1 hypothetical protein FGSG_12503 [Fusarium graminearum PH-1]